MIRMLPTFRAAILAIGLASIHLAAIPEVATANVVKQSSSGICHDPGSPWYGRTKNFDAFDSMTECLASGRTYSGYDGSAAAAPSPSAASGQAAASGGTRYDRDLYGGWADDDGDCMNTRHELLAELSTGQVRIDGCYVQRGRWNDPYTGKVFLNARDMDVDHMVPLAWAHYRGGHSWTSGKRETFANDARNLFAVDAGTNRSKGARGPLEWLPPNEGFHCEYITRFHRIVLLYDLEYEPGEAGEMNTLRSRLCN